MHCSFCNSNYHNIKYCTHPKIGTLYERMYIIYNNMMKQYPYDIEVVFKIELNKFNLRDLQAVYARYTNNPLSRPKQYLINILYRYFSCSDSITCQDEQYQLDTRLPTPTQLEPIP